MGFSVDSGSKKGVQPVMNVTPLVDVVLVLLIIFMVITPMLSKHIVVRVPEESKETTSSEDDTSLVVSLNEEGVVQLNKKVVSLEELGRFLKESFQKRKDNTVFFDASDKVSYEKAAVVLNAARKAGALNIAMATSSVEQ
jgi:biopolymer transport protein TolR